MKFLKFPVLIVLAILIALLKPAVADITLEQYKQLYDFTNSSGDFLEGNWTHLYSLDIELKKTLDGEKNVFFQIVGSGPTLLSIENVIKKNGFATYEHIYYLDFNKDRKIDNKITNMFIKGPDGKISKAVYPDNRILPKDQIIFEQYTDRVYKKYSERIKIWEKAGRKPLTLGPMIEL
jgi:hypothetical protein